MGMQCYLAIGVLGMALAALRQWRRLQKFYVRRPDDPSSYYHPFTAALILRNVPPAKH